MEKLVITSGNKSDHWSLILSRFHAFERDLDVELLYIKAYIDMVNFRKTKSSAAIQCARMIHVFIVHPFHERNTLII
jgi:hypothetical protein